MKFVTLFLVLMISIQPFQAGYCDMEAGKAAPHHMQKMQTDDGGHKCCKPGQPETGHGCPGDMLCGFCNAPVSTLQALNLAPVAILRLRSMSSAQDAIAPSHSPPLYRPPIS